MKTKKICVMATMIGCMFAGFSFPAYAYASDGEDYITISVDAVDDNTNLQYAIDSDDESAFTSSNEFTVPAGTSHTIYVKDVAGNITSQRYEPQDVSNSNDYDEEEQQINIDLELGRQEEKEIYSPDEEGSPGTASVTDRTKTDGSVDAEKVFYTFTTKEGEELYLVVDQGRGSDNVYLLDTVSLGDLRILADGQTSTSAEDDKEDNLLASLQGEELDTELEESETTSSQKKSGSATGRGAVILMLALIGGGGYYYLKIYRTKKEEAMDAMDAMDMDEFVPEEDGDAEMEFDYNDSEKEAYLDRLISDEDEDFYDQDPDAYATSHMDADEADEAETDLTESSDEDEENFGDLFEDIDDFEG